jgi:hypothetical protein
MARFRSLLLCDDIRREDNGKELLIGVYSGGIRFFGAGPGRLRQLYFRIELEQEGENLESPFSLELTAPSGAKLINAQDIKVGIIKQGRGTVSINHLDLVFYEEGIYLIKVVMGGDVHEDTVTVSFERPRGAN